MRADTPIYDRPPAAVGFALTLLWTSLGISVAAWLYDLNATLSSGYGPQTRFLLIQTVVMLVTNGFLAVICRALGLARNWARGALFTLVLLETSIYLLILLSVGSLLGPPRMPYSMAAVVGYIAYCLRAIALLLVMLPGRHWFRM